MRARELEHEASGFRAHPAQRAARLGFVGSLILALAGSQVGDTPRQGRGTWWFKLPSMVTWIGHRPMEVVFYAGMALLIYAWWQLGKIARAGALSVKAATIVLVVWSLPLIVGPPLFSLDIYSYAAQGELAHLGTNPYVHGPIALGPGRILNSVSSVWRKTPAPYGPIFVVGAQVIMSVFGRSLIAAVIVLRLFSAVGVALIVWFLPRLARICGYDPGIALWLAVLSPVAVFSFIASGHNDALMVGLLVAGVTLALERRPLIGISLCMLGAAVKLPAAAGAAFIAVSWAWSVHGRQRVARVLGSTLVAGATVAVVTYAAGLGWGWLGPQVLGVPTKLTSLASVPTDAVGRMIAVILNFLGLGVSTNAVISLVQGVGLIAVGALAVGLLSGARDRAIPAALAVFLGALVIAGPVLWPWYLTWALVFLAVTRAQNSQLLAFGTIAGACLVLPGGSPTLVGAAYVGVALVSVGLAIWVVRRGRWRRALSFGTS